MEVIDFVDVESVGHGLVVLVESCPSERDRVCELVGACGSHEVGHDGSSVGESNGVLVQFFSLGCFYDDGFISGF